MKRNVLLCVLNFIAIHVFIGTVFAQELKLSISDSLDRALKSNLDIQLQRSTLDTLSWENSWKWSSILPNVVMSANLSRRNVEPAATPNSDASQWGLNRSVSISSPIGPKLAQKILEVFGSYLAFKKGELTYENAIKTVLVSVQKAYYDLLIAEEELFILKKQLQVSIDQNKNLKTSYEAGLVEEYKYLQSQIQKLQIEQQVNAKQNSVITFSNNFASIIGEEKGTQFVLIEDIPDINEETIKDVLLQSSLEYNYNIQIAEQDEVILNIAQYASLLALLPTLGLSWQSTHVFQGDPLQKSWYSDSNWSDDTGALAFNLSFNISNLLPGSPVFLAYINARKNYKNHSFNRQKTEEALELKLVNLQNTLQLQVEILDTAQRQRDLARSAFEIMKVKYGNGLARLTEYQTAENNLLDAEKGYLLQTISIIKSLLDIQLLLGEENNV